MPNTIYNQNYRKIWSGVNGAIPKDQDNRSFEIHHIDGNRTNNALGNLICISIQEHYYIHLSQDDYYACYLIGLRMNLSKGEISKLSSLTQKERVKNGTHHLLKINGNSVSSERVKNGTHNFLGPENNNKRVREGTHPFSKNSNGTSIASVNIKNGTHNTQIKYICPYCKKEGKGPIMKRYHFNNCKLIS